MKIATYKHSEVSLNFLWTSITHSIKKARDVSLISVCTFYRQSTGTMLSTSSFLMFSQICWAYSDKFCTFLYSSWSFKFMSASCSFLNFEILLQNNSETFIFGFPSSLPIVDPSSSFSSCPILYSEIDCRCPSSLVSFQFAQF